MTKSRLEEMTLWNHRITIRFPEAISETNAGLPFVWENVFQGNGEDVWNRLEELNAPDHVLVTIGGLDFDQELSPWPAEAVFKGQPDFRGGADAYMDILVDHIMPEVISALGSKGIRPSYHCLAGYSMAGLFAMYTLCRCDAFQRFVSGSGSLWYPGFVEKMKETEFPRRPDCVYLSLGGKESKTNHPLMSQSESRTQEVKEILKSRGIPVTFEKNPGNHFREPDLRLAKGIRWVLTR